MKIVSEYSHLNGVEYLKVHHRNLLKEIRSVVAAVDAAACKVKVSKEKTMAGKLLYAPRSINAQRAEADDYRGTQEADRLIQPN